MVREHVIGVFTITDVCRVLAALLRPA